MCDLDLARRAVACKGWRWMPGMLTTHGARILEHCGTEAGEDVYAFASTAVIVGVLDEGELPDFRDPATRGCLLQLVREAWEDAYITSDWTGANVYGWAVRSQTQKMLVWGHDTEVAALVAALEAAPEKGL